MNILFILFGIGMVISLGVAGVNSLKRRFASTPESSVASASVDSAPAQADESVAPSSTAEESPQIEKTSDQENVTEADVAPEIDESAALSAQTVAIGEALDSGTDAQWSAGGTTGTIEVKSADDQEGKTCRRYRTIREGKRSAYATVCQEPDRGWVAAE